MDKGGIWRVDKCIRYRNPVSIFDILMMHNKNERSIKMSLFDVLFGAYVASSILEDEYAAENEELIEEYEDKIDELEDRIDEYEEQISLLSDKIDTLSDAYDENDY